MTIRARHVLTAAAVMLLALAACKNAGGIAITTMVLPTAKAAQAYWGKVRFLGGTGPYVVSVNNGALPDGLNIDDDGIISGTPAAPSGAYTFTITASDSSQPPKTGVSFPLTITVKPAIAGFTGGGGGYGSIVTPAGCDALIADEDGDTADDFFPDQTVTGRLLDLLAAKSGADDCTGDGRYTICLDDSAEIDLTQEDPPSLGSGVTLAGFRGATDGSGGYKAGGRIFCGLEERAGGCIRLTGSSVRITGLRIEGPGPYYLPDYIWDESLGDYVRKAAYTAAGARGVMVGGDGPAEIDNCCMYNWSYAAVHISSAQGVQPYIHHNRIYDCRGALGYGIEVRDSRPLIDSNVFAACRHAIAGVGMSAGNPPAGYEASGNLVESGYHGYMVNSDGGHVPIIPAPHCFDMHGDFPATQAGVAGQWLLIHDNIFQWTEGLAISVRGAPQECSEIYRNCFYHNDINRAVRQNRFWYQSMSKMNLYVEDNYILAGQFQDQNIWENIVVVH